MGLPVLESLITRAEEDGKFALPTWWKLRLSKSNGFEILVNGDDWQAFPVFDTTDRKTMARSGNHILRETQSFRQSAAFPQDAFAIAANSGGDALIVRPGSSEIFAWYHSTGLVEAAEFDDAEETAGGGVA